MIRSKLLSSLAALASVLLVSAAALAQETGPHKGALVEWGEEEYHLEFVPDAKSGTVTVYVYGSHEDFQKGKAKAIDAATLILTLKTKPAVTVKLEPKPAKDDAKGMSSV